MKHIIEQDKLTLFLEGELNSYNSEDVEKEIDSLLDAGGFSSVVMDLERLNYISSAGLRIIVRVKQRYDDTSLVRVPHGVYEIFDMVGFPSLIHIEKLPE